MLARIPEEVDRLFAEALHAGDLGGLVALYEAEAILVPQPGQLATGIDEILEVLGGFIALKSRMKVEVRKVMPTGDIALTHSEWSLKGTAPDGSAISMGGKSADVIRRQPDGTWLVLIDNPFGTDP